MHVSLSVMKPNHGYEQETLDSMHRYADAARTQAGLQFVTTLKDTETGELVGITVWASQQAAHSAGAALMAAAGGDDFGTLVSELRNYDLVEI